MLRILFFAALSAAAGWFWLGADRLMPSNYAPLALILCATFLIIAAILASIEWRKQIAAVLNPQTLIIAGLVGLWLSATITIAGFIWQQFAKSPAQIAVSDPPPQQTTAVEVSDARAGLAIAAAYMAPGGPNAIRAIFEIKNVSSKLIYYSVEGTSLVVDNRLVSGGGDKNKIDTIEPTIAHSVGPGKPYAPSEAELDKDAKMILVMRYGFDKAHLTQVKQSIYQCITKEGLKGRVLCARLKDTDETIKE